MEKIPHPNYNVRLAHPDFPDRSRDLLVERLRVEDPDNPDQHTWALESAWQPTEQELRALANGAPILLGVMGNGHPPVFLNAGEPAEDCTPTYLATHIERALGHLHAALCDRLNEDIVGEVYDDNPPEPDDFLRMWKEALQATINPPEPDPLDNIIIPDHVPEDLGNDQLRDDQ